MINSSPGNYNNGNSKFKKSLTILLVDNQIMFREGLKSLLDSEPDFLVVGTTDNSQDALKQVKSLQPDLVIIDLDLVDLERMRDFETIRKQFSNSLILILSRSHNDQSSPKFFGPGGGYLSKEISSSELKEKIRSLYQDLDQTPSELLATEGDTSQFNLVTLGSNPPPGSKLARRLPQGKLASRPREKGNSSLSSSRFRPQLQTLSSQFEQAIVLRQSPSWSRTIIWLILALLTTAIGWAYFAQIEQIVTAQGQLKPEGKVKEVEVPVNGVDSVVKEVYIEEGERVEKGDLLLVLDSSSSEVELKSSQNIRQSLLQENQFYRTLMGQSVPTTQVELAIARLNLPQEIASLALNRAELVAENQLFQVQLGVGRTGRNLNPQQLARLEAANLELNSRTAAAELKVAQLQEELQQNSIKLTDAELRLQTQQQILNEIEPLVEAGAFARIQYLQQQQQVSTLKAEVEQLREEEQRIELAIQQAREELTNTGAITTQNVLAQIASNQQQIANIDSQINKRILDNDKRIAEMTSKISSTEQTLRYQELRAPVAGTIFDLQASPGFVPKDAVVKIVPDDNLVAEIFIANEDIGFVRKGMTVRVGITAYSVTEFGDIEGEVTAIGSDALPPDNIYKFPHFPAQVRLNEQTLEVDGRELPLQSGMSVNASIIVREKRTVLSLVTEMFTSQVESIKELR